MFTNDHEYSLYIEISIMHMFHNACSLLLYTDPPYCNRGFPSHDTVTSLSQSVTVVKPVYNQQRAFPSILFTCNGLITKWIFGALDTPGIINPQIRLGQGDEWRDVFTLNPTDGVITSENVYEFEPVPPLKVMSGDILVLEQPDLKSSGMAIYYQQFNGPVNYILDETTLTLLEENDYPLISVVVTGKLVYMIIT